MFSLYDQSPVSAYLNYLHYQKQGGFLTLRKTKTKHFFFIIIFIIIILKMSNMEKNNIVERIQKKINSTNLRPEEIQAIDKARSQVYNQSKYY